MKGTGTLDAYAGQDVNLTGEGSLLIQAALFVGRGTLSVPGQPISATLSGSSELFSLAFFGPSGSGDLAPLTSMGGDYKYCIAQDQNLAPLTIFAYGGRYIPATPVIGYANLQPLVSAGHIVRTHIMTGSANLSPLHAKGGDYRYAEAPDHDWVHQRIAPLVSFGTEGTDDVIMLEHLYAMDESTPALDMVIVFTSTGTIDSVFTVSRELAQDIVDDMTATGTFSLLATFAI
ncbi:MAG: hypothetical protein RBT66_09935, partial [bacterium]|nr:hypothetical protein [bacterium]